MLRQADFVDRNNFADFLNRRGLRGLAAEIGVHRGDFSNLFINNWKGVRLFLVDPWSNPPGYEPQAKLLPGDGDRDKDYEYVLRRFEPHKHRIAVMRQVSVAAGVSFPEWSLDFVYIDGDHRCAQVTTDLEAWWPKVRPGGILAGHDFLSSPPYMAFCEVQPAVLDFASRHNVDVYIVVEIQFQPWSFYVVKPE